MIYTRRCHPVIVLPDHTPQQAKAVTILGRILIPLSILFQKKQHSPQSRGKDVISRDGIFGNNSSNPFTATPSDITAGATAINALREPIQCVLTLNDKDNTTFIGWKTGTAGNETLIAKGEAAFPKATGNKDATYTAVFWSYIDENGAAQKLPDGWMLLTSLDGSCYVVFGRHDIVNSPITFTTTGNEVKLILLDGARIGRGSLTATGKTLSVYAQSTGDNAGTIATQSITAQTINAYGGNIDAKIADGTTVNTKNNAAVTTTYTVTPPPLKACLM